MPLTDDFGTWASAVLIMLCALAVFAVLQAEMRE